VIKITKYINKSGIREQAHLQNVKVSEKFIESLDDLIENIIIISAEMTFDESKKVLSEKYIKPSVSALLDEGSINY